MRLGNFCISLAVKDIHASLAFYEKLGFRQVSGDIAQKWVVLKNETTKIGLFQGMFEKNMLTFNPGWDHERQSPSDFEDVRDIQKSLKSQGVTFLVEADEASTGVAHFMVADPDGNPILVDQHVPKPSK
jgi:catechol 2,3-dioxygenase-like lactoylglutathione lyase family enzyme